MSFKGLLSSRNGSALHSLADSATGRCVPADAFSALSDGERLAMLDGLEQSGLGWFWASDAGGNLTYLFDAIAARLDIPLGHLIGQPLTGISTRPNARRAANRCR